MSYPPGMTREDWKHIDGATHNPECPDHEDNRNGHQCAKGKHNQDAVVEWDHARQLWDLYISSHGAVSGRHIAILFCPYCGQDLGESETEGRCTCEEIEQSDPAL